MPNEILYHINESNLKNVAFQTIIFDGHNPAPKKRKLPLVNYRIDMDVYIKFLFGWSMHYNLRAVSCRKPKRRL